MQSDAIQKSNAGYVFRHEVMNEWICCLVSEHMMQNDGSNAMQYATEMEKIWAAEDRKGLKLSYPATLNPHLFEYHIIDDYAYERGPDDAIVMQQQIGGMIGFTVKLVNARGRKFTGRLHRNRIRSVFDVKGKRDFNHGNRGSGLTCVNAKGKEWRFTYNEITNVRWIDLDNGNKRMEITYDDSDE